MIIRIIVTTITQLVLSILIVVPSFGVPNFAEGQSPPGLDWRQIRTDRFTVIFPEAITGDAQRLANTLEHTYGAVSKTLRGPEKPVEVVLISETTESNGFVALAPRRTVWSTTPPQDVGFTPGEWFEVLSLHEIRHVVQNDRMRRGLVGLLYLLSGETGENVTNFVTPGWFWEGDAVGTETALSDGGRGRIPEFDLGVRALLLAGERYSVHKAYYGSYRDWYPDYYKLGYFMTTYVRKHYGPETWDKVMGSTANWVFYPFIFSRALKKHTGAGTAETYERTMDELTELWQAQQKDLRTTSLQVLPGQSESGVWTSYRYPYRLADGSVLVHKSGLADSSTLVQLHPDGRETRLCFYAPMGGIRVGGGKVAWNRHVPDPRWGRRSYSDVMVLDIASGRKHQITHKAKLFAPAPSADGTRLAAIEFGADRHCYLVVLETVSGVEQARFAAPDGVLWRTPAWSEDGEQIAVVRQDTRGNALERVDTASGEREIVLPHTRDEIGWPVFSGDYLLFNSPYSGIDNIYAIHLSSGARYRVTSRPLAAFHAAVDGDSLLFQDYTIEGYRVAAMPLDAATWTPIDEVEDRRVRHYAPLIAQEQGGSVLTDIPQRVYPVHSYRPLFHLLKIHSWGFAPDSESPLSFTINSNDLLNLSTLSSGVEYNYNERTVSFLGDFSLAAWYPIFNVGGRWGGRNSTYTLEKEDGSDTIEEKVTDTWTERSVNGGVEVPLNFSRGHWSSSANLSAKAAWTYISDKNDPTLPIAENQNGHFVPLTYTLTFSRARSKALRDLATAWGQRLRLSYHHTPFGGDYEGSLLSGQLRFYFPGLWAHHSLWLEGSYEWQDPTTSTVDAYSHRFESEYDFVRGYDYVFHHHFYQGSANYALPLLYPDLNFFSLLHLKRVKTNFFYNYGLGIDGSQRTTYQTAGVELTGGFNPLQIVGPEFEIGVRAAYRFDEGDFNFGAVFEVAVE